MDGWKEIEKEALPLVVSSVHTSIFITANFCFMHAEKKETGQKGQE